MPLFKCFTKNKRELEVTPRAMHTYADMDADSADGGGVSGSELVYPSLQPYIDRGSLLASVLNDSLATVLDRLGDKYSYNANLAATPKLLTLYADKNPEKCMFATPHLVASISPSTGVTWGWAQDHSARDPVLRQLKSTGRRDGCRELRDPELKFPPKWPPKSLKGRKGRNDALAVLAHQLGAAAIGARLGNKHGSNMVRHHSGTTMSSFTTFSSSASDEYAALHNPPSPWPRSPAMPSTPTSPASTGMPQTPTTPNRSTSMSTSNMCLSSTSTSNLCLSSMSPRGSISAPGGATASAAVTFAPSPEPLALSPYFVAPRGANYAVFLLDFGPSILRTRKTLAEVAPSIRRLLSNGAPVKDQREAFRGLAQGMGWTCDESTSMIVTPAGGVDDLESDDGYAAYKSALADDNLQVCMCISDGASRLDVTFNYEGRMTSIKMDLDG